MSRINSCKPDAKKKKTPTYWLILANGGKKPGRALGWNPAKGHKGYISTRNVKTTTLLLFICSGRWAAWRGGRLVSMWFRFPVGALGADRRSLSLHQYSSRKYQSNGYITQ